MEIASKPRLSTARVAAAALAALLTASPAHANLPFATAFGRPARPERPGRPARPERPARPARPGRPGRLTNATAPDEVALPPEPAEPVIEIPESALPVAPPTDVAGEEGDLRLVGQVDINGFSTGALQVFRNGAYGAVCIEGFDAVDAGVACRQLGFIGGTAIPLAIRRRFGRLEQRLLIEGILAPMVLENLGCTGNEARLVDCPGSQQSDLNDYGYITDYGYTYYGFRTDGCDPLEPSYAFVACGNTTGPEPGDLRLTGGVASEDGNSEFGRLEVFNAGGWGTVCDRTGVSFGGNINLGVVTDESVNVACRQLGFANGTKSQISRRSIRDARTLADRRVPTWLAGARCLGSEASLTDCPGVAFGNNTDACGLDTTLVVSCFIEPDPSRDGDLRLVGGNSGPGYEYGRLEIFLRGFWSTICDNGGFTPDSAQVACSILGYDGGSSLQFRQPYAGSGAENQVLAAILPVALATVDCNGTETSLLDCSSRPNDVGGCNIAGTNLTDATVLTCSNTTADCPDPPPPEEGSLRLRGGFGGPCDPVHTGFVEVFHFGEWGAICNGQDRTDRLAADVICRQLGFPHGTLVDPLVNIPDYIDYFYSNDYDYGRRYSPPEEEAEEEQERFWLSRVHCRGPEEKLVDCDLGQGFRTNNGGCTSNPIRLTVACRTFPVTEALEDVTTPGAEEGDLRLMDQVAVSNWELGRLEIFFEGSWSQVCAREFDGADADVACRQLGFGAGSVGPTLANGLPVAEPRLVFPVVALTTPGCTGSEVSLLDCAPMPSFLRRSDSRDCFFSNNPGLTLACVSDPEDGEEGAVRLTDGGGGQEGDPASGLGILEIFHAGAWGTVCEGQRGSRPDDYGPPLTDSTPAIICRQMGFADGTFQDVRSIPADVTLLPAWLGRISCVGNEPTLSKCDDLEFGNTETCGLTQRLICTGRDGSGPGPAQGAARLTGGSADPGGAWAYGRLEVSDGNFFSIVKERNGAQSLGRRGVQVACRTLGFADGAQVLSGALSGLPGPAGDVDSLGRIACQGDEATLADCEFASDYSSDYGQFVGDSAVALVCINPSGCSVDPTTPAQGDVRLVDISGITSQAEACDDVHFGAVEFFNDGRWGRICSGRFGGQLQDFVVDATVICRQLGFPFGSLMDVGETRDNNGRIGADYGDYSDPGELVWATDVVCTGNEARLDECFFPEDFGDAVPGAYGDMGLGYAAEGFRPRGVCRSRDGEVLGVVCRQFEIEESSVIRRL